MDAVPEDSETPLTHLTKVQEEMVVPPSRTVMPVKQSENDVFEIAYWEDSSTRPGQDMDHPHWETSDPESVRLAPSRTSQWKG